MSERIRVLEQRSLDAETAHKKTIRLAKCYINHLEKMNKLLEQQSQDVDDAHKETIRLAKCTFNHFEKEKQRCMNRVHK